MSASFSDDKTISPAPVQLVPLAQQLNGTVFDGLGFSLDVVVVVYCVHFTLSTGLGGGEKRRGTSKKEITS